MINTTVNKLVESGVIFAPMDGNHGELHPLTKDYVASGIPFIMAADLEYGSINYNTCKYITEATAKTLRKGFAKDGDVLLTHKATIGRTALLRLPNTSYAVLTPQVTYYRVKNEKILNPYYLKLYFDSPAFQYIIKKRAGAGSTRAYIGITKQGDLPVSYPDIKTQNNIVSVLKPINEKIANNSRMCSVLEHMAKTLYDYWFTQFDFPNAEGKPYRSSGGEMVWNDQLKRKIPKGWEAGQLSDIANITMGQSPAGETYNEDGNGTIFYQGCTDFGTRFPVPRVYTTAPTRFAQAGDILMSVRAPVGTLNVAIEDCSIGRGLAALNSKIGSQLYLWYTLAGFKQLFSVLDGNGTTFGSITKDAMYEMKVVIPNLTQVRAFDKIVQPIEQKIRVIEEENRELTKLRDWLLPMLMNGQATISDEEVTDNIVSIPDMPKHKYKVCQAARTFGDGKPDDTEALVKEYLKRRKNDT